MRWILLRIASSKLKTRFVMRNMISSQYFNLRRNIEISLLRATFAFERCFKYTFASFRRMRACFLFLFTQSSYLKMRRIIANRRQKRKMKMMQIFWNVCSESCYFCLHARNRDWIKALDDDMTESRGCERSWMLSNRAYVTSWLCADTASIIQV